MNFAEALATLLDTTDVHFVLVFDTEDGVVSVSNVDATAGATMLVSALGAEDFDPSAE